MRDDGRVDSDDDAEAILDRAARHIDRHELADARRLLTPLIGRPAELAPVSHCRLLIDWGWLCAADQRYAEARAFFAQAAAEAESLSLPHLVVEALREAGIAARLEGRRAEADQLLARSAELAELAGLWVDARTHRSFSVWLTTARNPRPNSPPRSPTRSRSRRPAAP